MIIRAPALVNFFLPNALLNRERRFFKYLWSSFCLRMLLALMLAQSVWQDYEGLGKGKGYAPYKRFQRQTREIGDVSTQARKKENLSP